MVDISDNENKLLVFHSKTKFYPITSLLFQEETFYLQDVSHDNVIVCFSLTMRAYNNDTRPQDQRCNYSA